MTTRRIGFETYARFWCVWVQSGADLFATNIWRDTAAGAERAVRGMYPNAELITAESAS
jgi:hypothetical protein